ncbi:kinase-like domain-containing protein [Rhizophagus irregularis DAOM 181602=DAOM 197198]|nr:kinase-like domain-containing protein [Rhizophagus irregularis DAOM 181602=DAOM 197198]
MTRSFEDINQIGVGGFAKVYSATWIDGKAESTSQDDLSWKKKEPQPTKVALKRLNRSQNMSAEYLNELKIHWNFHKSISFTSLNSYGMTKDPVTEEFMTILRLVDKGNLGSVLSHNFNNNLWEDKIKYLQWIAYGLNKLHGLGYFHKDFHSICNGLRPEFGIGTPEIYKKLVYKWKDIKTAFEEADEEIPYISTSYEKNPDAIYTSRLFTFNILTKPVNSSIMTSYLEENNEGDVGNEFVE